MSRQRNVNHEAALLAAKELFWQEGYAGTSTRELEEQTGLTRFTLQNVYGGKRGFFLDTLDEYLNNAEQEFFPDPASFNLETLAEWFEQLGRAETMPLIGASGCLAINSMNEFDRDDVEVNQRIQRYFSSIEGRFCKVLENARSDGAMSADLDPKKLSRLLVSQLLGLQVIFRGRIDDQFPASFAEATAAMIRSWMLP